MNVKQRLPWLVLLLASLVLTLGTASCGGGDEEGGGGEPAAEEGGGGEKIKVGLVTDIGGLNDRGFNQFSAKGLKDAEAQLGVDGRILESKSDADYIPNLSALAEEQRELIVSVGFLLGEATHQAAEEFPDTNFAIIDFSYEGDQSLPNLQGLVFPSEEAGYLAGVLAAQVTASKLSRTNPQLVVSTVGGQKLPTVDNWIAGFQQGVKDTNPKVKTLNAYSQDFVDQAKCKEIALDQIAKGSDVVFQVAGGCGLGALDAAKEKNVWGIGVDADQAYLGPHILTSALKRVEVAVFKTVEAVQNGEFKGGGSTVFDTKSGGTGLGKVSREVPKEMLDKVEQAKQKIVAGEIDPPATLD